MLIQSIKTVTNEEISVLSGVKATKKSLSICPICQTKGKIVKKITLRGHIVERYWDIISDINYFFCSNYTCPIIYFNNEKEHYFTQNSVKSRVSHKEGSQPKPICYCLNILEHVILDEILVKKCCNSLQDIKIYTGARTGKFCHITNPSGRCCGVQVNEVISKGLKMLEENIDLQEDLLNLVHSGCEYCEHELEFTEPSIELIADTCKSCNIIWEKPKLSIDNSKSLEEVFSVHLKVLKSIIKGISFEKIKTDLSDEFKKTDYLNKLTISGILSFDNKGQLIGAYPISPIPTNYQINIEGIGSTYAMCAIDSLGVAFTFNAKVTIKTIDYGTNTPIEIKVDPSQTKQIPQNVVITYKRKFKGSAATNQCPLINFYVSKDDVPKELPVEIFSFEQALAHAKEMFSPEGIKNRISAGSDS